MKRRAVDLFLSIAVFLTVSASAASLSGYPDVPVSHWACRDIMQLTERGIFVGYPNGNFGPDDELSLAELFALVCG